MTNERLGTPPPAGHASGRPAMDVAGAKVGELAETANEKADAAMTAGGQQMQGTAQALREKAPGGKAGELATSAAGALERGGAYLQRADVNAVMRDAEDLVRQYPLQAVAVGVGIGFLLALALRR